MGISNGSCSVLSIFLNYNPIIFIFLLMSIPFEQKTKQNALCGLVQKTKQEGTWHFLTGIRLVAMKWV